MFALTVETILLLAVVLVVGFVFGVLIRRSLASGSTSSRFKHGRRVGDGVSKYSNAGSAVPSIPEPPTPQAPVLPLEKAAITIVPAASVGIKSTPKPARRSAKKAVAKSLSAPRTTSKPGSPSKKTLPKRASKAKTDDLKLINGVGPQTEKKLNDMGIVSHVQIANWTKKDQLGAGVDLKISGKIEREKWVAQAKALVKSAAKKVSKSRKG